MIASFPVDAAEELTLLVMQPTDDEATEDMARQVIHWLSQHITTPTAMYDILWFCASSCDEYLAIIRGVPSAFGTAAEPDLEHMIGIANIADLPEGSPDLTAARLVAAAANNDQPMLEALILDVIRAGAHSDHLLDPTAARTVTLHLIGGPFRTLGRLALAAAAERGEL